VTGSAGRIGRAAVAALTAAGWRVRGFDRAPTPGAAESITGDLTDAEALRRAAREVQAMIHLGASPDDDDFLTRLLPNNLVGLHHALEAAREARVKRLLLASTGQVNWWQQVDGPLPIHPDDPFTPRHWYAVTKVAAEAAGKAFARCGTMTVLAVRLGWCPRTREQVAEIAASERGKSTYLSPRAHWKRTCRWGSSRCSPQAGRRGRSFSISHRPKRYSAGRRRTNGRRGRRRAFWREW